MGSLVFMSAMLYSNRGITAPVRLQNQESKQSKATTDDRSPVKKLFEVQRFKNGEALFI